MVFVFLAFIFSFIMIIYHSVVLIYDAYYRFKNNIYPFCSRGNNDESDN